MALTVRLKAFWRKHLIGEKVQVTEEEYARLSQYHACELCGDAVAVEDKKTVTTVAAIVSFNTATAEQLAALPEVGPTTVQRLIKGRPYASIKDAKAVSGMPADKWDAIAELVSI